MEAAQVVRHIFALCMEGRGPMQIAKQLKEEHVLNPTAYKYKEGIKTTHREPTDPYHWNTNTVVHILEGQEYTGCTVNFKTYTKSLWDKKASGESERKPRRVLQHPSGHCRNGCVRQGPGDPAAAASADSLLKSVIIW